jgi:dihydrofolate reductase
MRKLIVSIMVSLDGFCAGADGNPAVLPMHIGFDDYNLERMRAADYLLFGATTFDMFRGYWPSVKDDASAHETLREISRLNTVLPKLVVSDSLPEKLADAWRDTTEVVRRAAAKERIARLKQDPGGDILVFGSHVLWNDLLTAGLVDEIYVLVAAVTLGAGVPAFERTSHADFHLLEHRLLPGSNTVVLRYGVPSTTT